MKFWTLIKVLLIIKLVECQNPEMDSLIKTLADKLSSGFNELNSFLNAADIASKIKTIPKELNSEAVIRILGKSKLDSERLVSQTSDVVNKIQEKVTTEYENFAKTDPVPYNIECSYSNYMFYLRSKAVKDGPYELRNCTPYNFVPFTNDSLLGNIRTSRKYSTVQVPTNVFDSSREIQNVANYTENMDQTFALSENKGYIKWQFFCSNTGFFKIFPGIKWHIQIEDMEKDNTKVDFYDCRSEQWFLEATSYPKKMIIMVDRSGSMKGRRRIIANHTIYEILNTITENDYFNVILFTKEAIFADNKTTDILMQATEKNKKFIMDQLEIYFVPDGIADCDVGLKASFKVLQNERNRENGTSVYNYLVMIITDGSPQAFQEVIDEENKHVQARIFTYLIGQASTERDVVKQMACKNKGYAVEIATLADVKENVQKYLNVVARPNAIMRNNFFVWTGVHQYQMRPSQEMASYVVVVSKEQLGHAVAGFEMNVTHNSTWLNGTFAVLSNYTSPPTPPPTKIEIEKPEPIQMFVTVSKAAYDISNETAQKNIGNLLGAAGVDVPVSDFIKTAPFWKIGVNSYLFGVTHNGFVIFHPRYRPQDGKYVKYFYRNVDISELEIAVDEIITEIYPNQTIPSTLRDKIITIKSTDQPKFLETRSTYDIVDDYKTAFDTMRNYYVTGIEGTSYKFGLAVPTVEVIPEYDKLKDFTEMNISVLSDNGVANGITCNFHGVLANQGGVSLKDYEFCNLNKQIAALLLKGPLCLLVEVLTNENIRTACLQLSDGQNNTDRDLEVYLKSLYNEAEDSKSLETEWPTKNASSRSVGVQQIFSMHHFGLIRYYNYKNLSYEQFIRDHNAGIQDPLYQETILTSQLLNNPKVLVVRPLPNNVVKKTPDENLLVFTVATPISSGKEYKGIVGAQVDHQFYTKLLMYSPCTDGSCLSCNNNSIVDCYVITKSGLIVLNNNNVRNTGESLKEIDCILMESLVKSGVFKNQSLYDFQALCTIIPKIESFGNILIDPFTKLFRFSTWLFFEFLLLLQNFSLSSLLWNFSVQQDTEQFPELPKPPIDNSDINFQIYSSEAPLKQLSNLSPDAKDHDEPIPPGTKSKRQHESFVKTSLEDKIISCKRNLNGESFSVCMQRGVTEICKLDKIHNGKQSDQHVERLTSLNVISHCVTVCLILQTDFPAIWQEQDDCRQPNYMCRTVTESYTAIYPSSKSTQVEATVKEQTPPESVAPTYFQLRQQIITDGDNVVYPTVKQTYPIVVKNGTMCAKICPAKTWYAIEIENTNLILVLVHKRNPTCHCECHSSFGLKAERRRNISNPIENPVVQKPNYFSQFVPFNKEENSTDCSDDSAMSTMPLKRMITFLLLLFFLIVY